MRRSLNVRIICPLFSTGGGDGPYTTLWLLLLSEEISHKQLASFLFCTPLPISVEMKPSEMSVRILRGLHSWKHNPPFLELMVEVRVILSATESGVHLVLLHQEKYAPETIKSFLPPQKSTY